jgi:CheY-like chemotaxis protein
MHSCTILIVDDIEATRRGLSELIRLKGYDTLEAASAEDALTLLSANPDTRLVILDLQMPGAGGLWFRQQQTLNRTIAHIPVAVFTGGDLPSESFGFCARLKKPFSVGELMRIIEVQCGGGSKRASA